DDPAGRHGRAARLPAVGQPVAGHGGDEHVHPAGDAAVPHRPEVRDRRHHHERHQELRTWELVPFENPSTSTPPPSWPGLTRPSMPNVRLDHRVEPGDDGGWVSISVHNPPPSPL